MARKLFSLIRWPNLLIIAISMIMLLYFVIGPVLGINSFHDGLNIWQFSMLVVSTLFISIGGYIINDIADINADSLNKPGINIIGKEISITKAYSVYWVVTLAGVLSGTIISYLLHHVNFGLIFLLSAGLLWFYSKKYQCQPLIGNIVIAVLSSVSFGIVWLYEFYALSNNAEVFVSVQTNFPFLTSIVTIYMGFAFLVTLLREIIKDCEDYKGDNRFGCRTFTVIYGLSAARIIALTIAYLSLFATFFAQYFFMISGMYIMLFAFFTIDVLFIIIITMLHRESVYQNFTKISSLLKLMMIIGVLTMIIIKFDL